MCAPRVTRHTSIWYSSSCHTLQHGCFLLAQTPSFSELFVPRMNGLVCRRVLCVLCMKCTLHSNHRLARGMFQHTKRLLPGAAIFSLHTLASPSGRNMNYDEKKLTGGGKFFCFSFYLYRFRKYVSYGFPIINFCNPGICYEMPCTYVCVCIYIDIYCTYISFLCFP